MHTANDGGLQAEDNKQFESTNSVPSVDIHCYTCTNCRALDLSCNEVSGGVRVGIAGNVEHSVVVVQQTSYYKCI